MEKITFEKFVNMDEKEFTKERNVSLKRTLKRKFEISYDTAYDEKLEAMINLKNLCKNNFENYSVDEHRRLNSFIKRLDKTMVSIEELHEEFFDGEKLSNKREAE